ncbi:MAG: hypothetical protein JXR86_20200 [Spirochaetales bacterium]|nr:hypothetical protein [Spirochaetales bacterium]
MKLKYPMLILIFTTLFISCDLFGPPYDLIIDLEEVSDDDLGELDGTLVYEFTIATSYIALSDYYSFTVSESGSYILERKSDERWGDMTVLDLPDESASYPLEAGTVYYLHVEQGYLYGENITYYFYK